MWTSPFNYALMCLNPTEWQTVKTQIRRRTLRRLIWVYTDCTGLPFPIFRVYTIYMPCHKETKELFKGLEALAIFLRFFTRETIFMASYLLSCTPCLFWKGDYIKVNMTLKERLRTCMIYVLCTFVLGPMLMKTSGCLCWELVNRSQNEKASCC